MPFVWFCASTSALFGPALALVGLVHDRMVFVNSMFAVTGICAFVSSNALLLAAGALWKKARGVAELHPELSRATKSQSRDLFLGFVGPTILSTVFFPVEIVAAYDFC